MSGEEFIVAIVAIIGGLGFAGFLFWNIFSLIRQWIDRKSGNADLNPQFFRALGEFKKKTEKRLSNLEAIVSDIEEEQYKIEEPQETSGDIEIEEQEVRSTSEEKKDNDGNLRNMLNE